MASEEEEVVDAPEDGPPGWLTTFADLMSLLLTFFILLLSFAELNQKKFYSVIESIDIAFRGNPGPVGDTVLNSTKKYHIPEKVSSSSGETEKNAESLFITQIQDAMQNDLNSQRLSWNKTANGIKISALSEFLFLPETTVLREEAKIILRKIVRKTRYFKFGLLVKTYTDDHSVNASLFPSNWEFSLRRSTEIVRFIIKESKIPSSWAKAIGLASSNPMFPNNSKRNRNLNNRVELVYEVNEMIAYNKKPSLVYDSPEVLPRKKSFAPRLFNLPKEMKRTRSNFSTSYRN